MIDKRTREQLINETTMLKNEIMWFKNEIARLNIILQDYFRLEEERRLQLEAAKEVGKVISLRREQFRRNGGSTL